MTEPHPTPRQLLTSPRALLALVKDAFQAWKTDKASRLAAALAYYTLFSMAPLLILGITVVGQVLGRDASAARIEIIIQIERVAGSAAANAIQTLANDISTSSSNSLILTLISLVTLLIGASGVFIQLQDALDTVWGITVKEESGILTTLRHRFIAFAMLLLIGFLLLLSLVLSTVLSLLRTLLNNFSPDPLPIWQVTDFAISLVITAVLFAMIYKYLPNVKIAWSDVWIGAAITSLLFNVGKLLIGLYLGISGLASAYGAAGSVMVILVWVYYSAQIFLLGAEFTYVYTNQYGSHIRPAENAVFFDQPAYLEQETSQAAPGRKE